jgi:hypothetical protein
VTAADEHRSRYFRYDRLVDIVSVAEVWFTRSERLAATVSHFERFPSWIHSDGKPITPDFAVLFNDATGLVVELSNLARNTESLEALVGQIARYNEVHELPAGPAGSGPVRLEAVQDVDVVIVTPLDVMNATCDRLRGLIDDDGHPYNPAEQPMVLGWSFDSDRQEYTFVRPDRAGNPVVRDHGRSPGLGAWLSEGSDTLRGLPQHFVAVKAAARFMNDSPPPLYTATVLWSLVFPTILAESDRNPPADLVLTLDELVTRLREDYGYGRASDVRVALDFLKVARLAEESGSGWAIYFRDLGRIDRDVAEALLSQYFSEANKARPIHTAAAPASQPVPEASEPATSEPEPLFPSDTAG